MNRAIARRPLFERRAEARYFLAQLASRVREGQIEVIAYSLMTTHFHLLVRSPTGQMSDAMRRVCNAYSRWFNRCHQRDGALFRGRFRSRRVDTLTYRRALVRYIDSNPVSARIVAHPCDYALGSAHRYANSRAGPWLQTEWLQAYVADSLPGDDPWTKKYRAFAKRTISTGTRELIEARMQRGGAAIDLFDEIVESAPPRVLQWMQKKARLADGGELLLPVAGATSVALAMATCEPELHALKKHWPSRHAKPNVIISAALLRKLTGAPLDQIGRGLGVTEMTVRRYVQTHDELMRDPASGYAELAERIAMHAIDQVLERKRGA